MDDLRRARAILGVPQEATPEQLRTRYRELVKQWHPDRYASDPQGQVEAESRMREINVAFDILLAAGAAPHVANSATGATQAPPRAAVPGQRLTRDQIDRLVGSIGTDGPLDWLLDKRAQSTPSSGQLLFGRLALSAWFGMVGGSIAGALGATRAGQLLVGAITIVLAFRLVRRLQTK